MTNEMHSSYNQFLFHSFLSALHVLNESSLSKHVEQTENCGIKIDYKNCASRWSLTHCNMMYGTHNVKKILIYLIYLYYTQNFRPYQTGNVVHFYQKD